MSKIWKLIILSIYLLSTTPLLANSSEFELWLSKFKMKAVKNGISQTTIDTAFYNVKFLDRVIVYDNRQPEFFEKTNIYVSKRATNISVKKAKKKLKENLDLFNKVEKEFNVEKEIILALWSIETNYGQNFGKMDIISSLATLSFDKRRSAYFTKELLTLLSLMDKGIVNKKMLYGSWAGALGNFQFMPSTIVNYGLDYDNDNKIDLKKSLFDSVASAANYINKIGWKYNHGCFEQVKFTKKVDKKLFNHSARNIKNKYDFNYWTKKGLISYKTNNEITLNGNLALVLPDGDVNSPKYLTNSNYEKILKWNRSLRFGISVCKLANMIKNEI